MRKTLLASAVLSGLIFTVSGCVYTAHVRGLTDSDQEEPVPAGALICVAVDPEAGEVANAKEVSGDIEFLLSNKGYKPSNSSDAEYFLFFDLESKPLITRIRLEPLGGVRSGIKTARHEGPFDLTLSLRLIEAADYHANGMENFVWVGGAILNSTPTESPKFVDMLLVAAMKHFPRDTEKVVKTKIGLYDFRARRLRR